MLATAFEENQPAVSPGGEWLAYTSNESGEDQIYVQSNPEGAGKVQVSTRGGRSAVWSHDSSELWYKYGEQIMTVQVLTAETFSATPPQEFATAYTSPGERDHDISRDEQRMVMIKPASSAPGELRIVLNWFEELQRLVPTEQ